ncbi:MAG: beta-ketoacyl-ACP synthase 3 [Pirellulales bacterium]|nr:beta-ketoacyl-ACP synthase 3 [Pirellulales bacterium]
MNQETFQLLLCLPAQAASETEATIIQWHVSAGDRFEKGQLLAQAESAKSVFDFQAPCAGKVVRFRHLEGETIPLDEPVLLVETADPAMKDWLPTSPAATEPAGQSLPAAARTFGGEEESGAVVIRGIGAYLPSRVVTNAELVRGFPEITEDYVHQVTGIRERRWALESEKPSSMALAASQEAIRKSGIAVTEIDAIIVATTTPDMAMPSTACILQDRLNLTAAVAFDVNAACSGWLYAVALARSMVLAGMARNVLTVGVELQSRLLNQSDRNAYFLFGDGAGAAVIAAGSSGHRICRAVLSADPRGLQMARRETPGYLVAGNGEKTDPWIRLEGHALFRLATESLSDVIFRAIAESGWNPQDARWIIPHQANGRILKAVAKRSGLPFERFFLNVQRVGNTSSASIPLALTEAEAGFSIGDKLILCSVGAGMTTAAVSLEW